MPRLYIQMTEADKRYLLFAKKKLNERTNHDVLIWLIESDNFSDLCWMSMVEHELRKIAINIRQLSDSFNFFLAKSRYLLSASVICMYSLGIHLSPSWKCKNRFFAKLALHTNDTTLICQDKTHVVKLKC